MFLQKELLGHTYYLICFVGIASTSPLFYWTNLSDYKEFVNSNSHFFQYLAKSFMIVFAISYLVLLFCFYEFISADKKILARIGLVFGMFFSLLTSIHYFIQISAVRFAINNQQFEGIEHFLQANPISVMTSVVMLGWTVFFGLSSIFMYFALNRNSLNRTIKMSFLFNGISCLIAGFGFFGTN